jgi:uncharacterized membrane protein (DUF2068 family)
MPSRPRIDAPTTGLRAIALFEAGKGVLALLLSAGLAWAGPASLKHAVDSLRRWLRLDPDGGTRVLLDAIGPGTLHMAIAIAALYGGMRVVEAWGLWRARAWASWLGCIGAALYLPFELYSLVRQPGWLTLAVLLVNLVVVAVLALDLRRRRR